MVVEMMKETVLTLAQAAKRVPGPKGNISPATIYRWVKEGVHGRKLEAFTIGGRMLTTVEALARFAQPVDIAPEARSDAAAKVKERIGRMARPGDKPARGRLVNNVPTVAKRNSVRAHDRERAAG